MGGYFACLDPREGLGMDRLQITDGSHEVDDLERLTVRFSEWP